MPQCAALVHHVPTFVPLIVSGLLLVTVLVVVSIGYCISHRRLRKTFYGIEDQLDEEERKQEELETLGGNEVKVIQSMERIDAPPGVTRGKSQVKVMMRRRRANSKAPGGMSAEQLVVAKAGTPSPCSPNFKYSVQIDIHGFATQILHTLGPLLSVEFYRAQCINPHAKNLSPEDETRIGEIIVTELREHLEALTNRNPWICHGRLLNNTNWVVNGHENLLENQADLKLEMRIAIEQPIAIVLIGYRIHRAATPLSVSTPMPQPKSLQVASTPLETLDAVTPARIMSRQSVHTSSAIKRLKSAEPLMKSTTPAPLRRMSPLRQLTPQPSIPQLTAATQPGTSPAIMTVATSVNPRKSDIRKPQVTPRAVTPKRSPPQRPITPIPMVVTPGGAMLPYPAVTIAHPHAGSGIQTKMPAGSGQLAGRPPHGSQNKTPRGTGPFGALRTSAGRKLKKIRTSGEYASDDTQLSEHRP
uniref:SEA domain-containing protein n=1 Tax=Panagrellus redivivus TaxID=6233 RepID=A0A7E4VAY0_PANRE